MNGFFLFAGVIAAFGAAFVAPWLCRVLGNRAGIVLGFVPMALFAGYAAMLSGLPATGPVGWSHDWVPGLGVRLSFFADGLSLLFLTIITAIGTFIVWYASGYLKGDPGIGRFYLFLLSFMASMLGLVSADNLILLFVFWELTSITSYLLIGYHADSEASRRAALQALLVTGGGGLAMLAGLLALGIEAGTFEISGLLALPAGAVTGAAVFPVALGLILLGAFTKSAQFPFHFWLPNAMEAPAPVSAFLHSATMVKAGVFLLARLHPCLSPSPAWTAVVAPVGAATMLVGVFLALGQNDLKKILAYTTVAVLGTLTMLLGLGTDLAVKACMAYILAHALYKAALFMTSGSIDHETGVRDPSALGGLRAAMPWTAAAALLAALSMAGIPLLLGFVSKEYFYKALLGAGDPRGVWEAMGVAASAVMVALAGVVGVKPFWGAVRPTPKHAHEAPWPMWIGPLLLGLASITFGLLPGAAGEMIVGPAARAVLADPGFEAHLKLWHGWTAALGLSALTLALGAGIYRIAPRLRGAPIYSLAAKAGPERLYFLCLDGLMAFASWQTRVLQNGYLRNYLLTVGAFGLLLAATCFPVRGLRIDTSTMAPTTILGVFTCAMIAVSAVLACIAKSRFTAILSLGVVGLGVAMVYFQFSGPDLAMTQILVETLTLVLLVVAFRGLPLLKEFSKAATRVRDALISLVFGGVMAGLTLAAFQFPAVGEPISRYMAENSVPLAHGRNVVNVILVDFRALDTLGEITVLAIAALGVLAMLTLKPSARRDPADP